MNVRRITMTTVLGLVLGAVEWLLATGATNTQIPSAGILAIVLSRGVLGFAIGISACELQWWLHGLFLGFVFSLPRAFSTVWVAGQWTFDFAAVLIAGLAIGFLIQLGAAVEFDLDHDVTATN